MESGQSSLRLLFHCHNRRGLGHLRRGLNLATAVRDVAPDAEILFYTRNASARLLCTREFRCVVETPGLGSEHWREVVRTFAPEVIVYDTLLPTALPEAVGSPSPRFVYLMRKCREAQQQDIFRNPILAAMDRILIPHTPAEFAYTLPASLRQQSVFVGPIVRPLCRQTQGALREKYQLGDKDFLLVSTVGGGGFTEQAGAFFTTVDGIHQLLYAALPHLRHLVIQGPNFAHVHGSLLAQPGMTLVPYEAELGNLFALADLVIAEGGYNTVNEIRQAKTPAVFLPSVRNYDDQEERVRALQHRGLAFVFTDPAPEQIARTILDLWRSPDALRDIKARYADDYMETGNRLAAEKILELCDR